jgi:hypothetical protein
MEHHSARKIEKPRAELEIIPPGAPIEFRSRVWPSAGPRAPERIYIAKLGPIRSGVLFFVVGVFAVFALFLLLGAALITLAVIGMLTIGAIISAVWRGRSRRIG